MSLEPSSIKVDPQLEPEDPQPTENAEPKTEPQPPEEEGEESQQLPVAGGPQPLAAPLHPESSPGRHWEPEPASQQPASKEPLSQQENEDAVPQPPTEPPQLEEEVEPHALPEPQPLSEPHEETPAPQPLESSHLPPDPQSELGGAVVMAPETVKGVEVTSRKTRSKTNTLASELLNASPRLTDLPNN